MDKSWICQPRSSSRYLDEEFVFSHTRQGSTRKWNKAEDQCLTFHEWFEDRVRNLDVNEDVKWLSKGPNTVARRFSAYAINGYKFVIESRERSKKDENPVV